MPSNIDDPTLSGVFAYAPSGTGGEERGFMVAYPNTSSQNGYRAIQVAFMVDGRTKSRTYESNRWGAWYRLDNFGCNSLTDLASALGGVYIERYDNVSQIPSGYDLNNISVIGNYGYNTSAVWTMQGLVANAPSGISSAAMLFVLPGTSGSTSRTQILIETNGIIYYRQLHLTIPSGTTKWYKFTGTILQ